VAWIWSDELAEAAESAGLEHREIAAWRRRPVAFALHPDEQPESLARQMLGLGPAAPTDYQNEISDLTVRARCNCGAEGILAQHAVDG
jgi:hypothetical protein